MKKVCILTLGCKVNQYESEALSQMLIEKNYEVTQEFSKSDIYIINTCSVTNMSDRKSRQLIRKCMQFKNNPIIAVTGCYSQAKPQEVSGIEGVDIVIGTDNKTQIIDLIEKEFTKREKIVSIEKDNISNTFDFESLKSYVEKTRAIIKIQDGCNSFCSYCIIPYVRGRCRSRDKDEILSEVKMLAKNGYKEIVLSGIHVCNYGIDTEDMTFPKLLSMIEEVDGIERIRLSSVEPLAFNEEFFEVFGKSKKICPHFHISLQSGSDTVIKRMNRHYDTDFFENIVKRLREINPITSVTTDVIVGFPEETDEEFEETLSFIEKIRFLKVHTFKYSRRDGTKASQMKNQVPENVKDIRSKKVIELSDKIEKEVISSFKGKSLSVLFEEEKNGLWHGISDNYINVYVKSEENLKGKIKTVFIKEIDKLSSYGSIV